MTDSQSFKTALELHETPDSPKACPFFGGWIGIEGHQRLASVLGVDDPKFGIINVNDAADLGLCAITDWLPVFIDEERARTLCEQGGKGCPYKQRAEAQIREEVAYQRRMEATHR